MAELNKDIKIGSFVKWSVKNGVAVGEVKEVTDNSAAIETPTGYTADVDVGNLLLATEEEFSKAVDGLINNLTTKKGRKAKEAVASVKEEEMNTEALEKEVAELKAKVEAMTKDSEALQAKLSEAMKSYEEKAAAADEAAKAKDALSKEMEDLKAKCDDMMKEKMSKARFEQLKAVEGIEAIASDEAEAVQKLGEMTEGEFKLALSISTAAYQKLTSMSQTNEKKTTDQSVTSETKTTEAKVDEETVAEVLDKSKKEEDNALATSITDEGNKRKAISDFVSAAVFTKKKIVQKDKK